MLNIRKTAAIGMMALAIGGMFAGGLTQATTAFAGGGVPGINVEGGGVPGINVEGGGVPGIDVEGGGVPGILIDNDGIRCEDDECLHLVNVKDSYEPIFSFKLQESTFIKY